MNMETIEKSFDAAIQVFTFTISLGIVVFALLSIGILVGRQRQAKELARAVAEVERG